MISTARHALEQEPQTTHVMFVTESCIPIGTLGDLASVIYDYGYGSGYSNGYRNGCGNGYSEGDKDENRNGNRNEKGMQYSFLDCYSVHSTRCTRFDELRCFNILNNRGIPNDVIHKALPGWALFSRSHLECIINLKDRFNGDESECERECELYPLFRDVWAPEEVYFSTVLALLGKMGTDTDGSDGTGGDANANANTNGMWIRTGEVVRRSLMWSKWDERSRGSDRAHPIVYDGQFCEELVNKVREEGCLFMRKWKRRLNLELWEQIVLGKDSDGKGRDRENMHSYSYKRRNSNHEDDGHRRHSYRNNNEPPKRARDIDIYEESRKRQNSGRSRNYQF